MSEFGFVEISNELSEITVRPTGGGNAKAVINRVRVENGVSDGIVFSQTTLGIVEEAIVRDSVIAGNGAVGIKAVDTRGVQLRAVVEGTSVVNNGTGIMASGRVIIFVLRSVLVGNPTALTRAARPLQRHRHHLFLWQQHSHRQRHVRWGVFSGIETKIDDRLFVKQTAPPSEVPGLHPSFIDAASQPAVARPPV